jgi:hypothetical protein
MARTFARIVNHTDLAELWVRQVVAIVRGEFPKLPALESITLRNRSKMTAGWTCDGTTGRYYHPQGRLGRIVVTVPTAAVWPEGMERPLYLAVLGRRRPFLLGSRLEAMVAVLGHEMRHHVHANYTRYNRVWGSRGEWPERDAEAYSIHVVRAFRRLMNQPMMAAGGA